MQVPGAGDLGRQHRGDPLGGLIRQQAVVDDPCGVDHPPQGERQRLQGLGQGGLVSYVHRAGDHLGSPGGQLRQRLRRALIKGTTEAHLLRCAELAAEHGFRVLKVYMMVGVPGERDEDIDELVAFTRRLTGICPVELGVAPFVPKLRTPLADAPFAGIRTIEARLRRLNRGLRGAARVRPVSARWAWVEAVLAQGGPEAGRAVMEAVRQGGRFADYRRALAPITRVPR